MSGQLTYLIGDATYPLGDGNKIIIHSCNNQRAWGAGFVLALRRRWDEPEIRYREMGTYPLGAAEIFQVESDIWVANMICQDGFGRGSFKYNHFRRAIRRVRPFARSLNASIHMPRVGCGLGGGTWGMVEPIVKKVFVDGGFDVNVYDLPPRGE